MSVEVEVKVEIESDDDLGFNPVDILEQSTYESGDAAYVFTKLEGGNDTVGDQNVFEVPILDDQTSGRRSNEKSFPCNHCSAVFPCRLHLRKHMVSIFGKNACGYCHIGFTSPQELKSHVKTNHNPEEPYECRICVKTFRTQVECDKHSKRHDDGPPVAFDGDATDCDGAPPGAGGRHRAKCAGGRQRTKDVGGRQRTKPVGGRHRTKLASGPEPKGALHRTQCGTAEYPVLLKVERNFPCDQCGRRFPKKRLLRAHKCEENDGRQYACDVCNRAFARRVTIERHVRKHMAVRPFACDYCDKGFLSRVKLDKHRAAHAPGRMRHVCHVCFYTFPSRYHLGRHLVTHERQGLSTEFDSSRVLATLEEGARAHGDGARVAGAARAYVVEDTRACGDCGQLLLGDAAWAAHARTHGLKASRKAQQHQSHKCEVCDKEFTQSYYLKLHRRTHTGERPYACEQCDKRFTTSSKLSRHTRSHLGIKRYQCETCTKAFTRLSYLRLHMTKHDTQSHRGAFDDMEVLGS